LTTLPLPCSLARQRSAPNRAASRPLRSGPGPGWRRATRRTKRPRVPRQARARPATRALCGRAERRRSRRAPPPIGIVVGLHKILFHFEDVVHESILFLLPPPTCIARVNPSPRRARCAAARHAGGTGARPAPPPPPPPTPAPPPPPPAPPTPHPLLHTSRFALLFCSLEFATPACHPPVHSGEPRPPEQNAVCPPTDRPPFSVWLVSTLPAPRPRVFFSPSIDRLKER